MKQSVHHLVIGPRQGKGLTEITAPVARWVSGHGIATGLLTLFCRHTSASLLIQENADPDVRTDLEAWFEEAAPALTAVSLSVPVEAGRMVLGTWQGIYLFEHRAAPHRREIVLHLIGE